MRWWLIVVCAVMCASKLLEAHDAISTKLTWTQEISRIVQNRCASCHAPGGSAPMSLLTYAEVRPWAKAIKEEVLNRTMPPWGAVKGFGDFKNDISLTQDQITRIAEWVEGGAPEGDPAYLPPRPGVRPPEPAPGGRKTGGRKIRTLKVPATLLGIRPLVSAESVQLTANLPDGSTIPLLWLRNYKRDWDRTFLYREPIQLPKGAELVATPPLSFEYVVKR